MLCLHFIIFDSKEKNDNQFFAKDILVFLFELGFGLNVEIDQSISAYNVSQGWVFFGNLGSIVVESRIFGGHFRARKGCHGQNCIFLK